MRLTAVMITIAMALTFAVIPAYALSKQEAQKIEDLKKLSMDYFNKSEFDKAIPILNQILALDPKDKNTLRYLLIFRRQIVEPFCKQAAEMYFSGNIPEAIEKWENILKIDPKDTRVQALIDEAISVSNVKLNDNLYTLANQLWKDGQYEEAVKELNKIIDTYPNEKRAKDMLDSANRVLKESRIKDLYEKAEKFLAAKDLKQAIDTWNAILKIDKDQELASRKIASIQMKGLDNLYSDAKQLYVKGSYIEARDMYNKLLGDNPNDKNMQHVIDRLNKLTAVVPMAEDKGQAWAVLKRGLAHYITKDGNPRVALAAAWYATQIEPSNQQISAVRDFIEKELVSYIRTMDTPSPDMNLMEQYLFAALNHIYEGRYDLSISECTLVLELEPDNLLALKRMGSAYFAMGKKDKALSVWRKALQISPRDEELKRFIERAG